MRKIRVTKAPSAKTLYDNRGNKSFFAKTSTEGMSEPNISVRSTIEPVPEEDSNVEAEKGEVVVGDMNNDSIPEFYKIGGKRHYNGGTPLDLPANSFIFSRDRKLKIKDEEILKEFGKSKSTKGYTPAELASKYDLNDYRKILQDSNSDALMKSTAEDMIANYNMKLGKLALVQESKKGFPQGIPQIAIPYMEMNSIDPTTFTDTGAIEEGSLDQQVVKYGAEIMKKLKKRVYETGGPVLKKVKVTSLPKYQDGGPATQTPSNLGSPVFQNSFAKIQKLLTDPSNKPLQDAIYEDYKKKLPDSKLSKEEVIDKFINFQNQVYTIQAASAGDKEFLSSPEWDKTAGGKKNKVYNETATKLGLDPLSEDEIKSSQAVFQSLQDLSGKEDFKPLLGEFDFGFRPIGKSDQTRAGKAVSPIDGIFGNTTVGQMVLSVHPPAPAQAKIEAEERIPVERKSFNIPDITRTPSSPAQWWLQDIVKTAGAATDKARLKKYMPWGSPMQPFLPEPTFYDPTRELAANAEQMNIGTQGAAMFTGPQAFNARFSQIQGQGAKNSADILSRYNQLNVNTANQFAGSRAETLNRAEAGNKQLALDLYDKTTIANQQFDNSKAMARQELRSSFIDAISNRANAQVINQLYPQYNINPITGGMMSFTKGRPLSPTTPGQNDLMSEVSRLKHENPGFDDKTYLDAAKANMGIKNSDPSIPDPEYLKDYYGLTQGFGRGK